MPALSRWRIGAGTALAAALLAGCSGPENGSPSPSSSPSPHFPALLGLAGEAPSPLTLGAPYRFLVVPPQEPARVPSLTIPSTASAAVAALAANLGVPGPPISTPTGLGYNLGSTAGYQLTTNAALSSFNFHPNTPTDEVGVTPSVLGAEQFAEAFLSAHHVPEGGGVVPLPQLSFYSGSDRTVFFQWTLDGLPVVDIEGQPEEIRVDVARDQFQVTQLVGVSGAVPYGSSRAALSFPSMTLSEVDAYLDSGTIDPSSYLLDSAGKPFPRGHGRGPTFLGAASLGVVDSYGTAVPVYVFQVMDEPAVKSFVTCAVPPKGCLPLRFRGRGSSPTPSPSS